MSMSIKTPRAMSFAGDYVAKRTRKNLFFKQINTLIDWKVIEKELLKICKRSRLDAAGRPAYNPVVLFKMMLLQTWYGLSDIGVEEMVNDSLSAMEFCGLILEDDVPDHSTLSRFRKELTGKKSMDRMLRKINNQLEQHKVIVKSGVAVDASITDSPLSPKGKTTWEIATDRKEDDREDTDKNKEDNFHKLERQQKPGTDSEARWVKKGGKSRYGYKRHDAVDVNGIIVGTHTTTANEHDSKGLRHVLGKVKKKHKVPGVFTDKGYKVPDNDALLATENIKNRIQHKAYRNRPLTQAEKKFNKLISKSRWVVERTFGSMRRWFGTGWARYRGLAKMHTQHVIEAIAHNLKRAPGIIGSNALK